MSDLIDTSAVIDAVAGYYRMSVCPGFWDWFAEALAAGDVVLIPQVRTELRAKDESLARWLGDSATVAVPATVLPIEQAYRRVLQAIGEMNCAPASAQKFLDGADFHLVAYALAGNHRVVSHEVREDPKKSLKALKIPDLCDNLDVSCTRLVRMLEERGARFEWAGRSPPGRR